MYNGKRENLPSEAVGTRFEEFPTGIYEKHEGYSREKAEEKKKEIEKELFSLRNTLEIKVLIEDAPAGGFKVVNRSTYVKYPYC